MSQESKGNVIIVGPSEVSLKTTDVVERLISVIVDAGEVDVIGINEGIFLACSAISMATEIANVHVNDVCIANPQVPSLGKTALVSAHLGQKQIWDYAKAAEQEDKELENVEEQTVSVSRTATLERLLTISLLRLARFDKIRIAAAGGSIIDAIALALKLARGQISKEPVGAKLVHLYSITMRNDPTKSIAAITIYLQKGVTTECTKRQTELLRKLENGSLATQGWG
jgi:DNA-binding protein